MKPQTERDLRELVARDDAATAARIRLAQSEKNRAAAKFAVGVASGALTAHDRRAADEEHRVTCVTRYQTDARVELDALPKHCSDRFEEQHVQGRRETLLARLAEIEHGCEPDFSSSDLRELTAADGIVLHRGWSLPKALGHLARMRDQRPPLVWRLEEAQAALARLEAED